MYRLSAIIHRLQRRAPKTRSVAAVPNDFLKELAKDNKAKAFFETLNKTNLYSIAYRLQTAKKPETREKRMQAIIGSGAIPRKCMFLPPNGFLGFMPPRLRTKARERLLFFRSAV